MYEPMFCFSYYTRRSMHCLSYHLRRTFSGEAANQGEAVPSVQINTESLLDIPGKRALILKLAPNIYTLGSVCIPPWPVLLGEAAARKRFT
ncbi:hypothetical protein E2C01_021492 [Portunus trituberculatus]|uniref:Uncharacterized protein n=1 Tax=Portunus trituberculatus TaxID=210409 RepID=A0A5B7E2R2_PORTR|nr:hypothetical protein [Portunus trituberculatus]